jgi:hypothetical protein
VSPSTLIVRFWPFTVAAEVIPNYVCSHYLPSNNMVREDSLKLFLVLWFEEILQGNLVAYTGLNHTALRHWQALPPAFAGGARVFQ